MFLSRKVRITAITVVCLLAAAAVIAGRSKEAEIVSNSSIDEGLPRLLDLGSTSCTPCRMMVPEMETLERDYEGIVSVEFIDVNQHPDSASLYGIRVIPTQIFIDHEGNELFRHEGFMSSDDMKAKWSEFGYPLPERDE